MGGGGKRNGGSRWREERRKRMGNGLGEERPGQGEGQIQCVFVGGVEGAIQVRLSDGSRGRVRTLPHTLTLIKALDH